MVLCIWYGVVYMVCCVPCMVWLVLCDMMWCGVTCVLWYMVIAIWQCLMQDQKTSVPLTASSTI